MFLTYAMMALGGLWVADNILKIVLFAEVSPTLFVGAVILVWGIIRYRKQKKEIKNGTQKN
jgi:nicotinamide riboside transporter PnuC